MHDLPLYAEAHAAASALVWAAEPVGAQEISENRACQFEMPKFAAQAAVLDLILMHRAGIYAAPVYNT